MDRPHLEDLYVPAGTPDGKVPVTSAGMLVLGDPAGAGSTAGDAGRPPRLVPFGVKLRGANLVPHDGVGNPWATLYANWATKWGTIVKPQVDRAASVGANAIRLIGDVEAVNAGTITTQQYVDAYEQFVDYCANLGLYVYAVLSDSWHWSGVTKEQALPIMQAQAAMLHGKPNVIAMDVVQEIGFNSGIRSGMTLHDFCAYLAAGVRTVTNLPLTFSCLPSSNSSAAQWSSSTTTALDDVVDFFDFHPYYDTLTAADLDPFFTLTDKPLVIGEYGADVAKPSRYSAARDASARDDVLGSFVWAVDDNGPTSAGAGGLFDWSGVERTNLTDIFKTVPDRIGAYPGAGHAVQDEGTTLVRRSNLNFVGDYLTVTDDEVNDATVVTVETQPIPEPVVSGEVLMQDGVTSPPVPIELEDGTDWLYER